MKKYLMKGADAVFRHESVEKVSTNRMLGANSGNLVYLNSIYRVLKTGQSDVDMDDYRVQRNWFSAKDIDYINENYAAYICPFADAFRDDYVKQLTRYMDFIGKLKIPVIVMGIGLRAPYEPDLSKKFGFDDIARRFVGAVLDHSSIIGVRGEITGDYLKKLGFKEETDYTVIGCPSMYTFGNNLNVRKPVLSDDAKIDVNYNARLEEAIARFLYERILMRYPNSVYVAQLKTELLTLYLAHPSNKMLEKGSPYYPGNIHHELYVEDRVRFFVHAKDWLNYLKDFDLSIGGRLHGNIAALLAGCPSIFIPGDSRMRELVEYHDLVRIRPDEINENTDIGKLVEDYDDSGMKKVHARNLQHYIDFLNKNNLEHIYADGEPGDNDLEHFLQEGEAPQGPVPSVVGKGEEEVAVRNQQYAAEIRGFFKNYVWKREDILKVENERLKKENAALAEQLNRKSVRLARKIGDLVHI